MYKAKNTSPVLSTSFHQWSHLPIALELGHEMLTLYLLAKTLTDSSHGGVVDLDVEAFSSKLRSRPEFIVKRFEALDEYGLIFDPETHELFCSESIEQQLPVDDEKMMAYLHSILDLARNVESDDIRQAILAFIRDSGIY